MKPNKKAQLNELELSNIIGDYGAAGLQQIGSRLFGKGGAGQLSVKDKMAQNIFIRDFIAKATTNLDSAIQSGLVDPKLKGGAGPAPAAPAATKPGAPAAPAATKPGAPAATKPGAPAAPAATKPGAPAAPAANFSQRPTGYAGQKTNVSAAIPTIPKATPPTATKPAVPATPTTPALNPRAAGAKARERIQTRTLNKAVKEDKFEQLNYIFESILNLNEADPAISASAPVQASGRSISSHLKNWFKKYTQMGQVGSDAQAQIDKLISDVEATWAKDKGQSALKQLANLSYTVLQSDEGSPIGAAAGAASAADSAVGADADAATTAGAKSLTLTQIKDLVKKLRKRDRQSMLTYLQSTIKSGTTAPVAAPVTQPATAPVATKPKVKKQAGAPATAGGSAFGQMASQLSGANKSASSTGGVTTKTPTGVVHTAKQAAPVAAKPAVAAKAKPQFKAPAAPVTAKKSAKTKVSAESRK